MTPQSILIIDDDRDVAGLVAGYLEKMGGFQVALSHDGLAGVEAAIQNPPDLIILDLRLPGLNGTEVCRRLRKEPKTESVPVVMLSACDEEIDRVVSLEVGADDYVTKPFSQRELLLRVQAILRRVPASASRSASPVIIDRIRINQEQCTVKVDSQEVALSRTEFELLSTLARNAGRVLSRQELLQTVWDDPAAASVRAVDVHITRLRAKLGEAGSQIKTISGFGYTMDQ